jgi:aerobic-type carbon monoxide dehydrogenase small subunit (CoxS/CutS family)
VMARPSACTGYVNIVAAVKHAAGLIREGARAGARA